MSTNERNPEDIFHQASEITDPKKRKAYLDEACEGNEKLRAEVEVLLSSDEQAGSFLAVPPIDPDITLDTSSEGLPGTKIGRYELIQLIGEGGMGLVYLAQQKRPVKRQVALKIIKPGMDSKEVIARFEAERQALAVLEHPNIARVFDAGTTDAGRPYFVMEHVKGLPITRYCDEHKLNIEQRLRLFKDICEAVHHAHQKGIIHRDLKPSNILVSVHGDRAVPKIIDFGIAKAMANTLTEKTVVTYQGQLLGTPEYMSPEQVDLAVQDIDTRSDIYSLGVVLYELLAGVLPFERASLQKLSFAELQRTIREQEPVTPSHRLSSLGEEAKTIAASRMTQVVPLTRRLHRELEWIPLKAMRKDRCRRYKSASEMADDVQNYLNGNPLIAGPETSMYRVQKFVRKHAGSVATLALTAAAIILGLVISITMYIKAEDARSHEAVARADAEESRKHAEQAEEDMAAKAEEYRQLLYFNRIALADTKRREGDVANARKLLQLCPVELRRWEWHRLDYSLDQAHTTLHGHRDIPRSVAFSPDGKRFISGSYDRTIKIWNAATGKEIMTLEGHNRCVNSVAYSPKGDYIVSGGDDNTIRIWDAWTGSLENTIQAKHEAGVSGVAFSSDGRRIVSCSMYESAIKIWDAGTGAQHSALTSDITTISSVIFGPDDHHVIVAGDEDIEVWDIDAVKLVRRFSGHRGYVSCLQLSSDSKSIISGSYDDTIKIWNISTGEERITLHGHRNSVKSVAISQDGTRVASGDYDNLIKVWDPETGNELATLRGHTYTVTSLAFSPDGKRVLSSGWDNQIKLWNTHDNYVAVNFESQGVFGLAFSPDGSRIISTGARDTIWDVQSGVEILTVNKENPNILTICSAFSPDMKYIALGGMDTIRIWNANSGSQINTLRGHRSYVTSIAFSPNGRYIASGGIDNAIRIWDASSGTQLSVLNGHKKGIMSVEFDREGKHILSSSDDGTVKLWDVSTGVNVKTIGAAIHMFGLGGASLSPDGSRVAVAAGKIIRVFNLESEGELIAMRGHAGMVYSVSFSPDGERIVSKGGDETAKIWDSITGTELMTFETGNAKGNAVFSPDGRSIASVSENGILIWDSKSSSKTQNAREITVDAHRAINSLHDENMRYFEMIDKFEASQKLSPDLREVTLQIARVRLGEDISQLKKEFLEAKSSQDPNASACEALLGTAQSIQRLDPQNWQILDLIGRVQYHLTDYGSAVRSLKKAHAARKRTHLEVDPGTIAFLVMALKQLGHTDEAYAEMKQIHDGIEDQLKSLYISGRHATCITAEQLFLREDSPLYTAWEHIKHGRIDRAATVLDEVDDHNRLDTEYSVEVLKKWLVAQFHSRAFLYKNISPYIFGSGGPNGPRDVGLLSDYETIAKLDPNNVVALKKIAWLRITCTSAEFRDFTEAVKTAERACELTDWKCHECLSILAAAYSEIGDFESACKWQDKALPLLLPSERAAWEWDYRMRRELYQSDMPYHKGDLWSFSNGKLEARWTFDQEDNATLADESMHGLDGKLMGAAKLVSDVDRGTVLQIGPGGYVDCGVSRDLNITGSITVACWMKANGSYRDRQCIVRKGCSTWQLSKFDGDKGMQFYCSGARDDHFRNSMATNVVTRTHVLDGKWHLVVATYDGSQIGMFVDGMLDKSLDAWGYLNSDNEPLYIGDPSPVDKNSDWKGLIDDVRIYSYALNADEVKGLYEGKEPPIEKRLDENK